MTDEGRGTRGGLGQAYEVLVYLGGRGADGGTCQEIERAIRRGHRTVSARLKELEASRYAAQTPRKRQLSGGRLARVWVITPLGREDLVAREKLRAQVG